jgi:hypothetical protein
MRCERGNSWITSVALSLRGGDIDPAFRVGGDNRVIRPINSAILPVTSAQTDDFPTRLLVLQATRRVGKVQLSIMGGGQTTW